jgi:lysophospholipase L1-like esterase
MLINTRSSSIKRTFLLVALLSTSIFTQCSKDGAQGPEGPAGAQGPQGAQGIPGADGATILYGQGSPKSENGKVGDFYLDLSSSQLYGPKLTDGWKTEGLNLKGEIGKDGTNGSDGKDGANGTNGTDGATILSGETVPSGTLGRVGDFYFHKLSATMYGPKTSSGWGVPVNLKSTSLSGKKLVTIGDNMTELSLWQPFLTEATGMIWSRGETALGLNGSPRMAIGGSTVTPIVAPLPGGGYSTGKGPGESIYERASFAHLNKPDIIILWGGQNDGAQNNSFNPFDNPYTGTEVTSGSTTTPSFTASYKGTLVKLIKNNPHAQIYAMTIMYNGQNSEPNQVNYQRAESINQVIRDVCKMYSIPVIDLFSEVGITPLNSHLYFIDAVHPNTEGAKKIADLIFRKIK